MKKFTVSVLCAASFFISHAQFYKSFQPSPAFSDSLTRIVFDFRNDYKLIQGKELVPQESMEVFQSKVGLPGAAHCAIYRFHSKIDTTASWQALMYAGGSYQEAVKVYKNTYRLVQKSRIKWIDKSIASFIGEMEKPDENVAFATSLLQLNVTDPRYRNFYANIELTSSYSGWEVHLNLNSKKDDKAEF